MSAKFLIRLTIVTFGIFAPALRISRPTPAIAQAQSYPWCVSGENPQCYYMTRQQCEEEVDYHGFCVTNPDYRASDRSGQRPAH
jgi:hypothetical protein